MKQPRYIVILSVFLLCATLCLFTSCEKETKIEQEVHLFLASGTTYHIDLASLDGLSESDWSDAYVVTSSTQGGIYTQYGASTITMPLTKSGNYFEFQDTSGTYHTTHLSYGIQNGTLTVTAYVAGEEANHFSAFINDTRPSVVLKVTTPLDKIQANIHISLVCSNLKS